MILPFLSSQDTNHIMLCRIALLLFLNFTLLMPLPAQAFTTIRDSEIETLIDVLASDLIKAAGQNPSRISITLMQDTHVNAFVFIGNQMFITTELLLTAEKPEELLAVIAHELGHIEGGHIVRSYGEIARLSKQSLITSLLGIGAIIAGAGDLGSAIFYGASASTQSQFLAHTRIQENAADQAAIRYLKQSGITPEGMVAFMRKLEDQELLPASQQDAYIRTHPLTRDRIKSAEHAVEESPYTGQPLPAEVYEKYARMQAKLTGFLYPSRTMNVYPTSDTSIPAKYARTIAYYRQNHFDKAIQGINHLIALEPKNAWFHELKGQILRDFNKLEPSLISYRRAVELAPQSALIRIDLAHALTEQPRPTKTQLNEAEKHLLHAQKSEGHDRRIYRLLASVHGRRGDETRAQLYMAEEAMLRGDYDLARDLSGRVQAKADKGSSIWLRASDILNHLENIE